MVGEAKEPRFALGLSTHLLIYALQLRIHFPQDASCFLTLLGMEMGNMIHISYEQIGPGGYLGGNGSGFYVVQGAPIVSSIQQPNGLARNALPAERVKDRWGTSKIAGFVP